MALGLNLASDLEDLLTSPPATVTECADQLGTIIRSYTDLIAPPVAAPAQDAAKLVFVAALAGMNVPDTGFTVLDTAFSGYASALAAAMVPSGTPPPALLSLTLQPIYQPGYTHATAAAAIAVVIDAWFRTGLSSTAVPWS